MIRVVIERVAVRDEFDCEPSGTIQDTAILRLTAAINASIVFSEVAPKFVRQQRRGTEHWSLP
jgi:hypothetical protein